MKRFLAPPPHAPRLPEEIVQKKYPAWRMQVLASTFFGYASFYLVRNNLSTVAKDVGAALSYDKAMMGDILGASALAYGFGKLFMGALSDQSDARKFMSLGLALTALCNFAFGQATDYSSQLFIWTLNGFIQGMGWAPCGRALGHWFAPHERGTTFAIWNISHNVGGGIAGIVAAYAAGHWGWQYALYVPGILALIGAVILYMSIIDTPESVGLPPIEEYKAAHAKNTAQPTDEVPSLREILIQHVFTNKLLWLVAFANFFVYIARYSMLDWGPTYLREVKGATVEQGGWAVAMIEFGGIPSTILVGWFSDRLGGRRGMVSLLCMIPAVLAFLGIMYNPPGNLMIDLALLVLVGFCVYPPVMLLGVMALDIGGKRAVGAAAGFVGLLGYLGRTSQAKVFGSMVQSYTDASDVAGGWNAVLMAIVGCAVLSVLLLLPMWKTQPSE